MLFNLGKWCSWSRKELICWSCFLSQEVFVMICPLVLLFLQLYFLWSSLGSELNISDHHFSSSHVGYHFKEGLWTNLYYLLSTGVYSRWLLFFWLTLFFRHLQRELQSSLPNSVVLYHHIKKKSRLMGRDVPRAPKLGPRMALNTSCSGHSNVKISESFLLFFANARERVFH